MLSQQKQQPCQGKLAPGLRIIVALDLLLGVPLALWVLVALFPAPPSRGIGPISQNPEEPLIVAAVSIFVLALNGAGACVLLRQYHLARILQWLVALFALAYAALVVFVTIRQPGTPLHILLGAGFATVLLVSLAVLLQRFGED